jgi:uncharacterized protein (DUF2062 family)
MLAAAHPTARQRGARTISQFNHIGKEQNAAPVALSAGGAAGFFDNETEFLGCQPAVADTIADAERANMFRQRGRTMPDMPTSAAQTAGVE